MKEYDYLIIGGGIAGTSIGYSLAESKRVAVLEMEELPGYHTTGRSVAVWTTAYGPVEMQKLCHASGDFIHNPPEGFSEYPLYHDMGLMFIAKEDDVADLLGYLKLVQQLEPDIHEITPEEAIAKVPILKREFVKAAFYDPNTTGLEVSNIHQGYIKHIKAHGSDVISKAEVQSMERRDGLWHISTPAGEFSAPVVINAAGAWADVVAEKAGTRKIGIVPKRRTVIGLKPPEGMDVRKWPGVMDAHEAFYFKADGGQIVASPADETPDTPHDVQPDEMDIAITADYMMQATDLQIRRIDQSWAGLRCFVEDRLPAVGFADDVDGFFWFAAQGGYGIATSPALGRLGAAIVQGEGVPEDIARHELTEETFKPQRLWQTVSGPAD